jgi:hypothetical protein
VVEQGIWRKRTNQELRVYRDPDIVADMKKKRLKWIGNNNNNNIY